MVAGIGIALLAWAISQRSLAAKDRGTRFVVWLIALSVGRCSALGRVRRCSLLPTVPTRASGCADLAGIVGVYLVFVLDHWRGLGVLHVAHGLYRLRRLRATCTPIDRQQLDPALRASLWRNRESRRVTLCASDAVRVPAAIGYFRPMVVFPVVGADRDSAGRTQRDSVARAGASAPLRRLDESCAETCEGGFLLSSGGVVYRVAAHARARDGLRRRGAGCQLQSARLRRIARRPCGKELSSPGRAVGAGRRQPSSAIEVSTG